MATILRLANKATSSPCEDAVHGQTDGQTSSAASLTFSESPSSANASQADNDTSRNGEPDRDVAMMDGYSRDSDTMKKPPLLAVTAPEMPLNNLRAALAAQSFGNGWSTTCFPAFSKAGPPSLTTPICNFPPTILDAFTLRLLRTALLHGYLILKDESVFSRPQPPREFAHALQLRSRESLIEGMEFVLGPGHSHMFRASGATWKSVPELIKRSGLSADGTGYLTTVDVQEELISKGARMIDAETMEIGGEPALYNSHNLLSSKSTPASSISSTLDADEPRSYVDFFATRQPQIHQPPPCKLWVSVPLLISTLTQLGVCVSQGPVFPVHALWAAVAASVTMRQG